MLTTETSAHKNSNNTNEHILQIAETVFAESGFDGATMQEIADKVGLNKASLYYYYKSKEELYSSVIGSIFAKLEKLIKDSLGEKPGGYKEAVEKLVETFIDFASQSATYPKMLFRELLNMNSNAGSIYYMKYVEPLFEIIKKFVNSGKKAGVFKDVDAIHLVVSVVGMIMFYFVSEPFFGVFWKEDFFSRKMIEKRKKEIQKLLFYGLLEVQK